MPPGIAVGVAGDRRFIEKTLDIMTYLAATRGVAAPHP